jgi:glycosyltransferase involved in cell wall biosynthesis
VNLLFICVLEDVLNYGVLKTQVLELLYDIKKQNSKANIHLLAIVRVNYYRANRKEAKKMAEELKKEGVNFHFVPVIFPSRKFYLTTWERVVLMPQVVAWLKYFVLWYRINIIQGRSYIASLAGIWVKKILPWVKVMFDTRALYVDEGIVTGKWKAGDKQEKKWRSIEKAIVQKSDITISVSYPQEEYYRAFSDKVLTIPNCVNMERFRFDEGVRERVRKELGVTDKMVFLHIGSLYNWYDPEFVSRYFSSVWRKDRKSYLLIVTQSPTEEIVGLLEKEGVDENSYRIVKNPPNVEELALAGDWGLLLQNKTSASRVAHTVKFSEYLAGRMPVITFDYVGGAAWWIKKEKCGLIIDESLEVDDEHIKRLKNDKEEMAQNGLDVASEYLSTKMCAKQYNEAFKNILGDKGVSK